MFIYVHICSYMFIYVHIRSYTFIYVHNYTLSSHHHLTSVSSRLSSPEKGVKYVVFLGNNGICCCCCSSPFWLSPSSTQSNQISICCSSSFEKHSPKQNPSYSNFSSLAKGPKKLLLKTLALSGIPSILAPLPRIFVAAGTYNYMPYLYVHIYICMSNVGMSECTVISNRSYTGHT